MWPNRGLRRDALSFATTCVQLWLVLIFRPLSLAHYLVHYIWSTIMLWPCYSCSSLESAFSDDKFKYSIVVPLRTTTSASECDLLYLPRTTTFTPVFYCIFFRMSIMNRVIIVIIKNALMWMTITTTTANNDGGHCMMSLFSCCHQSNPRRGQPQWLPALQRQP